MSIGDSHLYPADHDNSVVVTETDREMAREALAIGWDNCKSCPERDDKIACDCDLGAVDGCVAKVEAIAEAIARARKI